MLFLCTLYAYTKSKYKLLYLHSVNHKTKISIKLVTSWCETACGNFHKSTEWFSDLRRIAVAFPCLSSDWLRHMELLHWLFTTFLQVCWRYLLLLIFEDIFKMYQWYFVQIPVNPTCVLPKSVSVDGTADMHCLLIDLYKNGKLATTISCYDDLSCKS